jgi:thymidylate kinase
LSVEERLAEAGTEVTAVGAGDRGARPALDLVVELCSELDSAGISWCHWKSNEALDRSASGENDLDLLVRRRDAQRFEEALERLGFKVALVPPVKELPGVFHAYGLDPASGGFVHVHAHYQLVLGDDMTKNYRIPVEEAYLESVVRSGIFPIPSAEWELAVFVIRMLLKHATWDAALSLQGRLSSSERREFDDLTARADLDLVRAIVLEHLPFIDEALWDRCLRSLRPGTSAVFRARTAGRLQRTLAGCARRPHLVDLGLKLWRRGVLGASRYVLRRRTPKRLEGGGALIAVVGGDGAGKSSAVDGLAAWLSTGFQTTRVHLGKPPRSLTTLVFKGAMWLGRGLGLFANTRIAAHDMPTDDPGLFPGYAWLIWHLCTARDRLHEYVRARRIATNGGLVICDRFPLPQLRFMDGSRTAWLRGAPHLGWLARRLVDRERRYYERIMPPDVLLVLRVDPDTAVRRRTDEDEAFVRPRSEEVWRVDWSGTPAHVVDAGRPKERVLAELRSVVWSRV